MDRNIAIITARGGSKRIPKKNIKEFCGRPVLLYSIDAAIKSGCFGTVMVSTDDEEIATIAIKAGAQVPFMRDMATADDYASTADVLNEVFSKYDRQGISFDYACCIYPTAPFLTAEKLSEAMGLLTSKNARTVMPVTAFSFPPQRAVVIKNGFLKALHPEYFNCRSQDLEPLYHDCGQFYAFNVPLFRKSGTLTVDNVIPIAVSNLEMQDIDNYEDWKIAEMKYRLVMDKEKTDK